MASEVSISPFKQAFTGEVVFGSSKDLKPILATDGLRSCIGFAGRDAEQKIGFLAHFMLPEQVDDFFEKGIPLLIKMSSNNSLVFNCVIRGGSLKCPASGEIIQKIENYVQTHQQIKFNIVQQERPSEKFVLKSLSLDLRNGEIGNYNAAEDPEPRLISKEHEQRSRSLQSCSKLEFPNL